jgi:AcrR family transcriptional regulator
MSAPVTPRRRADAARNDEILLDTALELLREKGPDRLSALDLARRAGLTTGAVYARYENNEEILVGLWQNRLIAPLRQFLSDSVKVLTEPEYEAENPHDPIYATLMEPSPPLLAAISLLIAAPRITELSEVVVPDIREILSELGVKEDVNDVRSTLILAAVSTGLGCLYFAAADMFKMSDWPTIRAMMRYVISVESTFPTPPVTPKLPFEYVVETGDEIRDALVNAATNVIGRSGFDRATTQRVARAAGLPPSALFSEYQNRHALFTDVVAKLLREVYQEHRYRAMYGQIPQPASPAAPVEEWTDPRLVHFRETMITQIAENTFGLLSDIGRSHRRIRLEFQLAAIHNEDVRAELQKIDESANVMGIAIQQSIFGFPSAIAGPGMRTSRTIAQGAMLLEDVTQMFGHRDIRLINGPIADFCCLNALGLLTSPTSEVLSPR